MRLGLASKLRRLLKTRPMVNGIDNNFVRKSHRLVGNIEYQLPGKLVTPQQIGLDRFGGIKEGFLYRNLSYDDLKFHEIYKDKLTISDSGAAIVHTGKFTGRSPGDKYIVVEPSSEMKIDWNDTTPNQRMSAEVFSRLHKTAVNHLSGKHLYCFDGFCGKSLKHRHAVRFVTELAWQHHFVQNMFIQPTPKELEDFNPDFLVLNASLTNNPNWKEDGLNSDCWTAFHLGKRMQVIGGLKYGGEMKKGLFALMNYWLPLDRDLPMHCAANMGEKGDTALFFGLSGTGKTTLSADPRRKLIGDDEHGWDQDGIFNFEGGCYAKVINLSREKEPEIHGAIKEGALLENVIFDPKTKVVDFCDSSITENTRVSYPIDHISNYVPSLSGPHPKNIIFLTCDAFGVFPPIAKLNKGQAIYHFLSGYTAKLAGTERGVDGPTPAFSACFGAAFLTLHPTIYADLLGEKIEKYNVNTYLVNTGWMGGSYPNGKRFDLKITRLCIDAILNGALDRVTFEHNPTLNVSVPSDVPGVDPKLLNPRNTWRNSHEYDQAASKLSSLFSKNFKQFISGDLNKDYSVYGPQPRSN